MSGNARECEERNKQLREEREVMLAHFQVNIIILDIPSPMCTVAMTLI
jgi:hypothetical protein